MTELPSPAPSLIFRQLEAGISPTLLCDLLDPAGMKRSLAGELAACDVARAAVAPARAVSKIA